MSGYTPDVRVPSDLWARLQTAARTQPATPAGCWFHAGRPQLHNCGACRDAAHA